jgi:hypothetical protein
LCTGVIRALAQAGVVRVKDTGLVDSTALETTTPDEGCGHVTRTRQITDQHGNVPEMEVTVYGWKLTVVIDALTTTPWAGTEVSIYEPEVRSMRALVSQVRMHLAAYARRHQVVFDQARSIRLSCPDEPSGGLCGKPS